MNSLNNTLFAAVKVSLYFLILFGIGGVLIIFVIIPKWVRTEEVLVPNLIGKTYYEAVRILDKEGLRPAKDIQEASSNAPKGEIVAQDPVANFRIKSYQPVTITVSIGAKLAPVPSVIGKSQDAAFDTLRAAGFRRNRVATVYSETYLQDTVIAQTPPEGGGQQRGSAVNLLVSLGPTPQLMQLPDFQGQSAADVLVALEAAGLNVETQYSSHPKIPEGAIIAHKPPGSVMVRTGDLILLEISGQELPENVGRLLPFKHYVSEEGALSHHVKIVIIDDSGERIEVDQPYARGMVIDLEREGVRVFGETRVMVYENGEKLSETLYK
ncbi:PASTA domain-containing protein [Candidatus Poribacteria bacterium]|nr:PASTA domain-containing protein [Candidatus Poribacteria bacterium]MYB00030.1 PASTA domain-containing protein [Candidatus Poribacteria bacterium]